jgi:hypothetical protein
MDPAVAASAAPFLGVHTGRSRPNPVTAPRTVLLAVPGATEAAVDGYIATRAVAGASAPLPPGLGSYLLPAATTVATIRVEAETAAGAVFVREAIVALLRDPLEPYRILSWKRVE